MNAAKLWPLAIVSVLAVTVGANVLILVLANEPDAAAIEPDYYRKAVAWDSTLAQRAHDRALGWKVDAELGSPGPGGVPIHARLTDAAGAALAGAKVSVEAIHNAEALRRPPVLLSAAPDSGYAGVLPLDRRGLWELRFEVRRGGERFTATLRRESAP
jgi:nitrogen fixation protein FixH